MRFTSPGEFPFKQRRGGPWSVLPSLSFPKGLVPLDGSQPVASESDGSVLPPLRQYIRLQKWDQEGNDVFLSGCLTTSSWQIQWTRWHQQTIKKLSSTWRACTH